MPATTTTAMTTKRQETLMNENDKKLEAELLRALLAVTYGVKPQRTCFQLEDCSIRFMTEEEVDAEVPPENN